MTNNPLISLALNQSVSQLNSIGQAIQRSLFELGADTSGSNPTDDKFNLINDYNALLLQVQQYTAAAPSLDLSTLNTKIGEMRGKMIEYDKRKDTLISRKKYSTEVGAFHYYLVWSLYVIGPIFSSVILLNALCFNKSSRVPEETVPNTGLYITGPYVVYKAFYAVLAMILYPLFLLYGGINPPVYAGPFPFYAVGDTPQSGIYYILGTLFGYKKPNPATDNPILIEKGRVVLRFISVVLFLIFMYTFIFFDDISPLSQ